MSYNSISVICPCYNEEPNIDELIFRVENVLKKINEPYEIILIDDASTDKTWLKIQDHSNKNPNIKSYKHKKNLGLAETWKTGVNMAEKNLSIVIDSDLQYQPEDIYRLYNYLILNKTDIVQGWRSSIERKINFRFIASKILNKLLNLIFNMNLKDNKSGFIICETVILKDILSHKFKYNYYQTFLLIAANKKKYTISDIEVIFEERTSGKSFLPNIPIIASLKVLIDICKAFVEFNFLKNTDDDLLESYSQRINDKNSRSLASKLLLNIYFITLPLHTWMIGMGIKRKFNALTKTQYLSRKEIEELQLKKLKKLINHAYKKTFYYKDLFDKNNLHPSDIKSLNDIEKIPILDKKIINENISFGILSTDHNKRKILKISTSGSTGTPFSFYVDKEQLEMRWAATLRSQEWTGYEFGDKCLRLWHQTIGMSKIQVLKEKFDAFLTRRKFIPAYNISDKKIDNYLEIINKFKPKLLDGYAESFNFLSSYLKDGDIKTNNIEGIMSSAQELTEKSRNKIENFFNAKTFDKYGSREFSGIAYESGEPGKYLIVAENYIVEITRNGKKVGPGEIGEILITDLNNYCLPFLRYKIGDLGTKIDENEISKCGRELPLIGPIIGRSQAVIVCAENKFLPGTFFSHFFKEYEYLVKQYQVIQNDLNSIELKIIKGSRYSEDQFKKLIKHLKEYIGINTKLEIDYVDNIELVRTGKHQGVVSNIEYDISELTYDKK